MVESALLRLAASTFRRDSKNPRFLSRPAEKVESSCHAARRSTTEEPQLERRRAQSLRGSTTGSAASFAADRHPARGGKKKRAPHRRLRKRKPLSPSQKTFDSRTARKRPFHVRSKQVDGKRKAGFARREHSTGARNIKLMPFDAAAGREEEARLDFASAFLRLFPASQLYRDTPGLALRSHSYSPEKKGLDERRAKSGGKKSVQKDDSALNFEREFF